MKAGLRAEYAPHQFVSPKIQAHKRPGCFSVVVWTYAQPLSDYVCLFRSCVKPPLPLLCSGREECRRTVLQCDFFTVILYAAKTLFYPLNRGIQRLDNSVNLPTVIAVLCSVG